MWKVYLKVEPKDTLADVYTFDDRDTMDDFIHDCINSRVQFTVDHSPVFISEEDIEEIRNYEESLITIVAKRVHEDWSKEKITTREQEFWKVEEVQ